VDVPLGRYLGAAWDQGIEDSAFSSISQMTENYIYGEGRRISSEEANKKYSVPGLNFQEPVYESVAKMMRERHQRRLDRELLMDSAETFSGRWWGGLGVGVLSSFTNPLDFALNFMPVVGSEKYARASALMGRGTFRTSLVRGLITEEALAASRVPFPKLTGAIIEGAVGQAIAEVPIRMAKELNLEQYGTFDSITNIVGGSILGGAIHLGVTGAARLFRRLSPETKKVLAEQAVEQFLKGEDFKVHQFVEIDEARIRERVAFDASQAKDEAVLNLNEREIRRVVREEFDDEVVAAAVKLSDGTINIGPIHYIIEGAGTQGSVDGFFTAKGKFISREQAFKFLDARALGPKKAGAEDFGLFLLEDAADDLDFLRDQGLEGTLGKQGEQSLNAKFVRDLRIREEEFFARPDVAALVEVERQKRIAEFVEARKREYDPTKTFSDEVLAEIERQKILGRILTPDQIRKYGFERNELERTASAIDEDVRQLEKDLGIKSEGEDSSADASKGGDAPRKAPDLNWRVTVQRPQVPGDPGYVQVDDITGSQNKWSKNPEKLQAEGYDIPGSKEFMKLDQGRYTLEEALFMMDESVPMSPEERALLDAVTPPETKAIDIAADCIRRSIK
jgi:hypothetical protein